MNKRTSRYVIAGGVGMLLALGVVLLARSLMSQSADQIAPVVQPDGDLAPAIPTASPAENYQMNPPEAGLVDGPNRSTSQAPGQSAAAPVSTPRPALSVQAFGTTWLKPGPVDSKDTPLGPLISPSILVEKSALRLTVFDGDAGVKSYRIAAGAVRGDKQVEGDRKTPEGDFYICIRKTTGQTPYTRSMGLSYPNIEDARRGRRQGLITASQYNDIATAITNKSKPPWQTKLGGAIMIHGKREGRTGTLGCVALDDSDVMELYRRLPLNTPVRIIP